MDFRELLNTAEYDFIRTNERLGDRIILLGLGGSYAYGTNNEGSDIDFRGVTLMMPSDLLGMTKFEQFEDDKTDTVIYGFNKLVGLLLECNPNTIEMLGLDDDQYLIKSPLGQELLDNSDMFLSKRAIKSFGGYAGQQLRRLQNAIARHTLPQSDREKHILRSVTNAVDDFNRRYASSDQGGIRLYIDDSDNPEFDTEIFVDADYKHYPLRDYTDLWGTMRTVVRDYDKIGKRNKKKDDNHLNKHAMHLVRLFMLAAEYIEKYHEAPPVLFDDLLKLELDSKVRDTIDGLLKQKKLTTEKEENPHMPAIREFIRTELEKQKDIAECMTDDHNKDVSTLDMIFSTIVAKEV